MEGCKRKFHVRSYEDIACPVCSGRLIIIGTRKRGYKDTLEEKQKLIIRRLRCKHCRRIHHELPDIIVPYKRHCTETIEKVIAGDMQEIIIENGTINRIASWWKTSSKYFWSVKESLKAKYDVAFSVFPAPREIIRAVANANLWIHTRSAFLSG